MGAGRLSTMRGGVSPGKHFPMGLLQAQAKRRFMLVAGQRHPLHQHKRTRSPSAHLEPVEGCFAPLGVFPQSVSPGKHAAVAAVLNFASLRFPGETRR